MDNSRSNIIWIVALGLFVVIAGLIWFLFLRPTNTQTPTSTATATFNTAASRTTTNTSSDTTNTNQVINTQSAASNQKVFSLVQGPIAGATLIQTSNPTTTIARYVDANNGHVFDLVIDSPGSIPKAISNTTIPGVFRVEWEESGNAALLQYYEGGTLKTVYAELPIAASTSTQPVKIQFLPDDIADIAISPDGKNVTYILETSSGVDGYVAKSDGTSSKKLFSLPLSEIVLSWPSQNAILAQTKSAAGTTGALFSVNSTNGNVIPILFGPGLTGIGNQNYTEILYQTRSNAAINSFLHNVQKGTDSQLSFTPSPEKCIWNHLSKIYCATSLQYTKPSYLDLWHQGAAAETDSLISYNPDTGVSSIIATPGEIEGGEQSDISSLAASPDDHYLLYIEKGSQSLWGVRLTQ